MMILVGPSASGKTEVAAILIKKYNMKRMVTYTTRPIRINEINGVSYNFVSINEFEKLRENNELVESVCYSGNYYGTRKKDVSSEKIVILEPNGLKTFKEAMGDKVTSFFLNTSEEVRRERMIKRLDKEEDIKKRLENDKKAFACIDYNCVDFTIENENITLEELADRIYKKYTDLN